MKLTTMLLQANYRKRKSHFFSLGFFYALCVTIAGTGCTKNRHTSNDDEPTVTESSTRKDDDDPTDVGLTVVDGTVSNQEDIQKQTGGGHSVAGQTASSEETHKQPPQPQNRVKPHSDSISGMAGGVLRTENTNPDEENTVDTASSGSTVTAASTTGTPHHQFDAKPVHDDGASKEISLKDASKASQVKGDAASRNSSVAGMCSATAQETGDVPAKAGGTTDDERNTNPVITLQYIHGQSSQPQEQIGGGQQTGTSSDSPIASGTKNTSDESLDCSSAPSEVPYNAVGSSIPPATVGVAAGGGKKEEKEGEDENDDDDRYDLKPTETEDTASTQLSDETPSHSDEQDDDSYSTVGEREEQEDNYEQYIQQQGEAGPDGDGSNEVATLEVASRADEPRGSAAASSEQQTGNGEKTERKQQDAAIRIQTAFKGASDSNEPAVTTASEAKTTKMEESEKKMTPKERATKAVGDATGTEPFRAASIDDTESTHPDNGSSSHRDDQDGREITLEETPEASKAPNAAVAASGQQTIGQPYTEGRAESSLPEGESSSQESESDEINTENTPKEATEASQAKNTPQFVGNEQIKPEKPSGAAQKIDKVVSQESTSTAANDMKSVENEEDGKYGSNLANTDETYSIHSDDELLDNEDAENREQYSQQRDEAEPGDNRSNEVATLEVASATNQSQNAPEVIENEQPKTGKHRAELNKKILSEMNFLYSKIVPKISHSFPPLCELYEQGRRFEALHRGHSDTAPPLLCSDKEENTRPELILKDIRKLVEEKELVRNKAFKEEGVEKNYVRKTYRELRRAVAVFTKGSKKEKESLTQEINGYTKKLSDKCYKLSKQMLSLGTTAGNTERVISKPSLANGLKQDGGKRCSDPATAAREELKKMRQRGAYDGSKKLLPIAEEEEKHDGENFSLQQKYEAPPANNNATNVGAPSGKTSKMKPSESEMAVEAKSVSAIDDTTNGAENHSSGLSFLDMLDNYKKKKKESERDGKEKAPQKDLQDALEAPTGKAEEFLPGDEQGEGMSRGQDSEPSNSDGDTEISDIDSVRSDASNLLEVVDDALAASQKSKIRTQKTLQKTPGKPHAKPFQHF